jgi:Flp pilus assembly protein TadG
MYTATRRRQKGSELVEFAFTAVLLFMLLFGIIEFSVVLFDKATITNAGREGARTGILFRPEPRDLAAEDAAIQAAVDEYAEAYLMSLGGPASMDVAIQRNDLNADAEFNAGDELIVTVTYPYDFLILPQLATSMTGGLLTLSATTVMRAE